jgi:hypothetical protein
MNSVSLLLVRLPLSVMAQAQPQARMVDELTPRWLRIPTAMSKLSLTLVLHPTILMEKMGGLFCHSQDRSGANGGTERGGGDAEPRLLATLPGR